MMYKICSIIPVYNGQKYIKKCLDSVLNQTLDSIQIVVVDDGSNDNTKIIVEGYVKKYKNIIYIYQENGRQGKARNNGMKYANSEYISFIDSDDYIAPSMYKDMYELAKKGNYDIVMCDGIKVYSDRKVNFSCFDELHNNNDIISKKEYFLSLPCPWNKIFKTEFLRKVDFKFPEGITSEDYAVIPTLSTNNPNISYIKKNYYYYVQTDNSTTRNKKYNSRLEDIFEATDILYKKTIIDEELVEELEYHIIVHLLYYSSLDFLKYNKKDCLLRISKYIKDKFPNWYKNKYYKQLNIKVKVLCYLFYRKKTCIIKLISKLKGVVNGKK